MDTLKKFLEWLKPFPTWIKCIILVLVAGLILIISMSFTSCGTPKTIATVQNVNPNSSVTVTMTVSNSVTSTPTVDTSPVVSFKDSLSHGKTPY